MKDDITNPIAIQLLEPLNDLIHSQYARIMDKLRNLSSICHEIMLKQQKPDGWAFNIIQVTIPFTIELMLLSVENSPHHNSVNPMENSNLETAYTFDKNQVSEHLKAVNSKLMEKLKSMRTLLFFDWPGEEKFAITTLMPILQNALYCYRSFQINPEIADSADELELLHNRVDDIELASIINEKWKLSKFISEQEALPLLQHTDSMSVEDFIFSKTISQTNFTKIYLATEKKSNKQYAIKVIPHEYLALRNLFCHLTQNQRFDLSNEFIAGIHKTFIGQHKLYFLEDYFSNGDLITIIENCTPLDESTAKNYVMKILQAINYLHSKKIIHRAISPDHILIDSNGNLRLTNIGNTYLGYVLHQISAEYSSIELAKMNVSVPFYYAPELILNIQHDYSVDYWSLGCIAYELLTGVHPFQSTNIFETGAKILIGSFHMPEGLSPEACDFLQKTIVVDPAKRGGAELINHPWFTSTNEKEFIIDTSQSFFLPAPRSRKFKKGLRNCRSTEIRRSDIRSLVLK